MLSIIISACLANDPNVCRDYRISVDESLDTQQCVMYAPPHFAQWIEEHPGWKIRRWRCTTGKDTDI